MQITLEQIARLIGADIAGEPGLIITGVSGIKEAKKGDITFLANPKYLPLLKDTQASAIIVPRDVSADGKVYKVDNPSLAFSRVVEEIGKRGNKAS